MTGCIQLISGVKPWGKWIDQVAGAFLALVCRYFERLYGCQVPGYRPGIRELDSFP